MSVDQLERPILAGLKPEAGTIFGDGIEAGTYTRNTSSFTLAAAMSFKPDIPNRGRSAAEAWAHVNHLLEQNVTGPEQDIGTVAWRVHELARTIMEWEKSHYPSVTGFSAVATNGERAVGSYIGANSLLVFGQGDDTMIDYHAGSRKFNRSLALPAQPIELDMTGRGALFIVSGIFHASEHSDNSHLSPMALARETPGAYIAVHG